MDSSEALNRLVQIAEEQLRWQRAAVTPQVRKSIEQILTTVEQRKAYEMFDGSAASKDVAKAVGKSPQSVSNWTRNWRDAGIAYEGEQRNICHLISLSALGIPLDFN